jgi:hypothetical protein
VQHLVLVADLLVMARRFFDSRGVEPAEQVRQLCEVSKGFDAIHATCVHVDKALRDGGAKWLDSVTAPCASGRARSVQIRLAMDRLRKEVSRLSFQVECPQHYRPDVLGASATAALELEDYGNEMLAILKNRLGAPSDPQGRPPRAEEAARGVGGGDNGGAKPLSQFEHADDFTWVIFAGQHFAFSKGNQSESVRALWGSWEKSGRTDGCGLSEKTIGEKCGSENNNFRLQHVLRDHPAWGTIIRPVSKGIFALFAESTKNHTS